MFWGLTIEPGKHYSQTVEQSFHVSMAALDTREETGMTQVLVRHEKAEFMLCTLQYGAHPFPILQQQLSLNLAEGSEISFYSEGKGTIHLTGYLVMDEPMGFDPDLLAKAESALMGEVESSSEEDEDLDDSEEDSDEEYDEEDSDIESDASAEISWTQMIEDVDEEEDEDSEEEEWTPQSAKKSKQKRKALEASTSEISSQSQKKKRKAAVQSESLSKNEMDVEDNDEEEDDQDFMPPDDFNDDDEDDEEDDDEDEDFDEEDEEEEEEEEEDVESTPEKKASPTKKEGKSPVTSPTKKVKKELSPEDATKSVSSETLSKKKKKKNQQQATQGGVDGQMPLKNLKADNKENIAAQKKEKQIQKVQQPLAPTKVKLQSGTLVEELKVGDGKLAKPGKKVFMYYKGVLQKNKKQFDACLSGKPFMFQIGRGEVIQGWDDGIVGMKVGGKRKLTVPPSQGYGSQKMGPIPGNSTLVFEVELKQVR